MRLYFLVPRSLPALEPCNATCYRPDVNNQQQLWPASQLCASAQMIAPAQAVPTQVIAPAQMIAPAKEVASAHHVAAPAKMTDTASKDLPVPQPKAHSRWDSSSYFL